MIELLGIAAMFITGWIIVQWMWSER